MSSGAVRQAPLEAGFVRKFLSLFPLFLGYFSTQNGGGTHSDLTNFLWHSWVAPPIEAIFERIYFPKN